MGKFVIRQTKTGTKFDLKAGNGEVIATSEVYASAASCKKGIASVAKNAPIAVRACKKAINEGLELGMDDAIVLEEKLFGSCFETADQVEGMSAFLEKRKHEPYQNK